MTGTGAEDQADRLRRAIRGIRRKRVAALVGAGLGCGGLLAAFATFVPPETLLAPGSLLPLLLTSALVGAFTAFGLAVGLTLRCYRLRSLVPEIERAAGLRAGELRGALELTRTPPGVSVILAKEHRERIGQVLEGRETSALLPTSARHARRAAVVGGLLLALGGSAGVLVATVLPQRSAAALGALARPWRIAVPPPLPALRLQPESPAVLRGGHVVVRVTAPGRSEVRLAWASAGHSGAAWLPVALETKTGVGTAGPVDSPIHIWAEDHRGSVSDTVIVRPLDPLLVTALVLRVRYPAYLSRESESFEHPLPQLVIPTGTRLELRGQANIPLETASLEAADGSATLPLQVEGNGFSGEWVPVRDTRLNWRLEARSSPPGSRVPPPIDITVVRDRPPQVSIVVPGADTVLTPELLLPLVIDAADDDGLAWVDLISWRASAAGAAPEVEITRLQEGVGEDSRLLVRTVLSGRGRGLAPGDTLVYAARAKDLNPGHPPVSSDTFRARVPTEREGRLQAASASVALADEARSMADATAGLSRQARDARRRLQPADSGPAGSPNGAQGARQDDFASTEAGRRLLRDARSLEKRLEDLAAAMAEERGRVEQAAGDASTVGARLRELEVLYSELRSSDLRDRLGELERGLRDLEGESLRNALSAIDSELRSLQEWIDRSVALLERVAIEQSLKAARERADELAQAQQATAKDRAPNAAWAARQRALGERVASLEGELGRLAERLRAMTQSEPRDRVDAATRAASRARSAMAGAAGEVERAASGESRDSPSRKELQAAEDLRRATENLDAAARALDAGWRAEALAAVDRATGEALELAREQAELARSAESRSTSTASLAARQSAVAQGLRRLLQSLADASLRTALLDRRAGPAATRAANQTQELAESLAGGNRPIRWSGEARAAAESLNELAARLLASRQAVQSAESTTGMEEALERLARAGGAQSDLNGESAGLLRLHRTGVEIGLRLSELARKQAAVARSLDELSRSWPRELPGRPGELAGEADAIARQLAAKELDLEVIARQERLFRRLLDAGRTLERGEDADRREATTARRLSPGPREPATEVTAGNRYPYPDAAALRRVPQASRRLVLDYFDRLNRVSDGSMAASPTAGEEDR